MSSRIACMCCRAAASSNPVTKLWRSNWSGAATGSLATPPDRCTTLPMNDVIDFPVKPETRAYLDAFAARGWQAREPDWLAGYRRRSVARFAELGFPSRRSESWRYIDLRALEEAPLLPAGAVRAVADGSRAQLDEIGFPGAACRLVLVDGRFAPEFSNIGQLPSGVWFGGM